jgi:maleamate amidohydrolase
MADDEAHRPFFGSSIERLQGSPDLQMPPALAEAVTDHLEGLRTKYEAMDWAKRSGWGESAAVIVVDLALYWTRPSPMGSNVDSVVESSLEVIEAARRANLPVFFSTWDFDPDEDPRLASRKSGAMIYASADGRQDGQEGATPELMEIDPRLRRRASEKLFPKRYASCFKGTALASMLNSLGVDTVIVVGVSTSHCVYATCRDACESFRVIVPREAVGERCQIMHMVNLLDIDIDLGDVMPTEDVVSHLDGLEPIRAPAAKL